MRDRNTVNEPLYTSPRTYRNYDLYLQGCAYARGWNDAMDYVFKNERHGKRDKTDKHPDINVGNISKKGI